jgi:hypothetical protein
MRHTIRRHTIQKTMALMVVIVLIGGCAAKIASEKHDPHFGQCVEAAFAAQVLHPEGPADASPADLLPGDLADQIYKKRYVKGMTEEKKEKADTSSKLSGLD